MARVIGSLDDLEVAVAEATQRRARDRRAASLNEVQKIKDAAQSKADRLSEEIVAEAQVRAEEARRQRLAEATDVAQRQRLSAREALLDEVWAAAEERLRALAQADAEEQGATYAKVLRRLAFAAAETLGVQAVVLAADPKGHELLTQARLESWAKTFSQAIEGEPKVTFERADAPLDAWGGLVAMDEEERKRVDLRFSERLTVAREDIRDRVYRALIGNG